MKLFKSQVSFREINKLFGIVLAGSLLWSCCDKQAIPKQRLRLYSSAAKDRNDAALELARCGSAAGSAVPKLSALLYDENVGVQSAAAYALRRIDTEEARRVLENARANK